MSEVAVRDALDWLDLGDAQFDNAQQRIMRRVTREKTRRELLKQLCRERHLLKNEDIGW